MSRRILPSQRATSIRRERGLRHPPARNSILGMPPTHGSRVHPGVRLTTAGGRMPGREPGSVPGRVPGGRAVADRAGRGVAVALVLAALGLPGMLLAGQAPAVAAASQRSAASQVSVVITGMTPQQAAPGATITVTGLITSTASQPLSGLSVQLLGSSTPVSRTTELGPAGNSQDDLASTPLPHGTWQTTVPLRPGGTDRWSVQVNANSIGMTRFGVYPLTAQAQISQVQTAQAPTGQVQLPVAATTTFLPYVPARKGPYGNSIPARTQISWVLPLIGKPLLGQPWQNSCVGARAKALVASLRSSGRLGQLVAAGQDSAAAAAVYSAAAGSGRSPRGRVVRSEPPPQNLSRYDGVTWAIDPALLANVRAIAGCRSARPRWASAARGWLARLRQVTSAEPVFFTAYADPDVAALVANPGQAPDVKLSFDLGQQIGQQILRRNPRSSAAGASAPDLSQAAGVAWPAGGVAGYSTVENLAAQDGIRTLVLSQSAMPGVTATAVRVTNGAGGYMTVLLASDSLTRVLAAGGRAPDSAFAIAQDFLAQTALDAEQNPGAALIVAPPRRFDPAGGLTADLLAATAAAPWLSPVGLTSLTSGKHVPEVPPNSGWAGSPTRISRRELRKLASADRKIAQLQDMAASPDNALSLAVSTAESSAWQGTASGTALAMLRTITSEVASQEQGVQIFAEPKVVLGGLKGSVPVSIDNRLSYPIRVRLQLQYSHATGVRITMQPSGLVTVPASTSVAVKLTVQATQVGSTVITITPLNSGGQPLTLPSQSLSMTVEATQVGVLVVIICAAAVGIFLIAYAARVVRRGRPSAGTGQSADPGPAADQGGEDSTKPAEPDTVMAERTQLGRANAPGP